MKIHWGKRILSAAVVAVLAVCMVASAYMSNPAQKINSLTTEDYLEDYDYMCSVIEEEYPYLAYFEAQGMDYKAAMEETRKQVEDVSSLQEFSLQYFWQLWSDSSSNLATKRHSRASTR